MFKKSMAFLCAAGFSMLIGAAELKVENKDCIRYNSKSSFRLLPYNYGMLTWTSENKKGGSLYFMFETKHPVRYYTLTNKNVSPSMKPFDGKCWSAKAKAPGSKNGDIIDVVTSGRLTQFNSLEVTHSWKTGKPENILAKSVFINYNLNDFAKPLLRVSGREVALPDDGKHHVLVQTQESPEIVLYAGTVQEMTIVFDGKCRISCFSNKGRNSCLRIDSLAGDNEFRYTVTPK